MKQTVVANLEAPWLKGVATSDFVEFVRERQIYELSVQEKNKYPNIYITPTSYRQSVERNHLKGFVAHKLVDATSVDTVTEEQLKAFFSKRAARELNGGRLHLINQAVQSVKMDLDIPEPENCVLIVERKYIDVIEAAGFPDLPQKKPQIAIGHILNRIRPTALCQRMNIVIKYKKDGSSNSN